jgi:hypothetical protein
MGQQIDERIKITERISSQLETKGAGRPEGGVAAAARELDRCLPSSSGDSLPLASSIRLFKERVLAGIAPPAAETVVFVIGVALKRVI